MVFSYHCALDCGRRTKTTPGIRPIADAKLAKASSLDIQRLGFGVLRHTCANPKLCNQLIAAYTP